MEHEKSIDVDVPVSTAYNQWTQFKDFPKFMEGVQSVEQLDDTTLRWKAEIAGVERIWTALITEQTPDQRIAWTSQDGAFTAGVVNFHKIDDNTTKVNLMMDFDPEGLTEHVGDKLGFVTARISGDLKRFKDFIESRGTETGAWRGEVKQGQTQPSSPTGTTT